MACVTNTVVESHSDGKFSLRSGCLYNRIVAAVMCVCVLGEVWHNPFWIVKFRISIPRINHKVEKKIIGGEL